MFKFSISHAIKLKRWHNIILIAYYLDIIDQEATLKLKTNTVEPA